LVGGDRVANLGARRVEQLNGPGLRIETDGVEDVRPETRTRSCEKPTVAKGISALFAIAVASASRISVSVVGESAHTPVPSSRSERPWIAATAFRSVAQVEVS
jgi:hypothetical protein